MNENNPEEIDKSEGATEKVVLDGDETEEVYDGPSDDVPRSVNEVQDDLEEDEDGSA